MFTFKCNFFMMPSALRKKKINIFKEKTKHKNTLIKNKTDFNAFLITF